MSSADVIILGGGIAGVSLAAELAGRVRVILLELESQLGRHATGRSAAMYFETYGNEIIQKLTRASRSFFLEPPAGFADTPLLHPRGLIRVADERRSDRLIKLVRNSPQLREIAVGEALRSVPILNPHWVSAAASDDSGFDINVAALTQGYLVQARRHGVQIVLNAVSTTIERRGPNWIVAGPFGEVEAPILVNATGAWADEVAKSAQLRPLGLTPYRRTAMIIPPPESTPVGDWPMVLDLDEEFYFKPDGGRLLLSPANEDPDTPGDTVPDDLDVAVAVDRFERATTMSVSRVTHRWAGLRTFAPDRTPVVGYDPQVAGFFWLAGQGGYGLQTAPAMSRLAAALVLRCPVHPEVMPCVAQLSPGRTGLPITADRCVPLLW
jgi:D-arginine dehydrogenase